eukprot:gb/GFBE01043484.1/.p1 GENE.gb/GFBE01043484.1/~~gb/GFBE01043484.1/.p1  ORF type:complete len:207 (+),score=41.03 gb/GFBE01043484.1/:1-621(+)
MAVVQAASTSSGAGMEEGRTFMAFTPGPLRRPFSLRSSLDGFLEAASAVDTAAETESWGGSSISYNQVLDQRPEESSKESKTPAEYGEIVARTILNLLHQQGVIASPEPPVEVPPPENHEVVRKSKKNQTFSIVKSCSRVGRIPRGTEAGRCPICLDKLADGQRARTLPCFHLLHDQCSAKYFKADGVRPCCPVCREEFARKRAGQ